MQSRFLVKTVSEFVIRGVRRMAELLRWIPDVFWTNRLDSKNGCNFQFALNIAPQSF